MNEHRKFISRQSQEEQQAETAGQETQQQQSGGLEFESVEEMHVASKLIPGASAPTMSG